MKRLKKLSLLAFAMLSFLMFSASDLQGQNYQAAPVGYDNPQWAPPYYPGVRYYYLPDIETYYDLESREFVFLYNGQWCYSQECPSVSMGFDLNTCFAIALDINVYQPWMHHHYYISHYPRYYYRDYYDHSNIPYVRGFNENSRSAFFWKENERHHARNWDREALKTDHKFRYSDVDRQQQKNWNNNQQPVNPAYNVENRNQSAASPNNVRTTQGTNYYGKTIGQPVKVEKQMRRHQDDHNGDRNGDNRR